MKIRRNLPDRLELAGNPHGLAWMLFSLLLGAVITTVCLFFISVVREEGQWLPFIPLGFGVLFGTGFFLFGLTQLFEHERLTIDRTTNTIAYRRWNTMLFKQSEEFEASLERIKHLQIRARREDRHKVPGEPGVLEAKVVSADLLISKPRKRITLDETQNGREARVRSLAERVASFLEVEVEEKA